MFELRIHIIGDSWRVTLLMESRLLQDFLGDFFPREVENIILHGGEHDEIEPMRGEIEHRNEHPNQEEHGPDGRLGSGGPELGWGVHGGQSGQWEWRTIVGKGSRHVGPQVGVGACRG